MADQAAETVFTKIINGDIPSHRVYEDDNTYAFMDIYPIQPGMVLVVSKAPVDNFEDLSEADYQALWSTVQKVAKKLRQVFPDKKKIGVQVEGLDVPHAHVKLIPINSGADFHAEQDTSREPDHASLAEFAQKIQLN
jgi:histidine triad (HIT) family protein